MRGDDGVGAAAVDRVRRTVTRDEAMPDLVVLDGEPTRLIDAWRDRQQVIVIDAARSGARPGTIHRVALGQGRLHPSNRSPSSHGAGVAEAIALAEALDVLPASLVLFGVEAGDLGLGSGLSPEVEAAVPGLVDQVLAEVAP